MIDALAEKPVRTKIFKANMSQAWDKALDSGRIPDKSQNWWRLVHRNGLQSRGKLVSGRHIGQQKRVLSVDEVGLTLADLHDRKIGSELITDVLTLYLWTGCRGGELVQMRGDALREDSSGVLWWKLDKQLTKVGSHPLAFDLNVPLLGRAREIADRRKALAGDGFLFPSRGRQQDHVSQCTIASGLVAHHVYSRIRPQTPRGRFQVANWSAHDLRRTVRTHLAAMGCPDKVAENMLGHIDSSIEGVYNRHGYTEHKVEWLTKLSDRWEAALTAARAAHGPWRPWSETREQTPGVPSI
jgi:integrase